LQWLKQRQHDACEGALELVAAASNGAKTFLKATLITKNAWLI